MIEQLSTRGWNLTNPQCKDEPLSGIARGWNPTTPQWENTRTTRARHNNNSKVNISSVAKGSNLIFQYQFMIRPPIKIALSKG